MGAGSKAADRIGLLIARPGIAALLAAAFTPLTACGPDLTPAAALHGPATIAIEDSAAREVAFAAGRDDTVLVTVSAQGVDVKVAALADGAEPRPCDAPNHRMGVETLLIEPPHGTRIVIRIERADHSAARGRAMLEATALPAATTADRARLAASRADARACHAYPELARRDEASAAYAAAAESWAEAGDRRRTGLALLHAGGVRYARHADWRGAADLAARAFEQLERSETPAASAYALRLEGAALDQLANSADYGLALRAETAERARRRLADAARRFDRLGIPFEAGYARSYLGVSHGDAGEPEPARAHFRAALQRFRAAGDAPAQAVALQSLAYHSFEDGRVADAIREFEQALALIPRHEEPANFAHTLHNSALPLRVVGRFDEALAREHESARMLRELGDRDGEARALHGLGLILRSSGETEQAAEAFRAAIRLRGLAGVRREQAMTLINLAETERLAGRPAAALELDRQALEMVVSPHDRARALLSLARDNVALGDRAGARRHLESVLALELPVSHRMLALALAELAALASEDGRAEAADGYFRRAIAIHEANQADVDHAQTLQKRATARLRRGDAAGALADAEAALTRFERVGELGLHAEARAAFRGAYRDTVELQIAAQLELSRAAGDAAQAQRRLRQAFAASDRAHAQLLAEAAPAGTAAAPELLAERQQVYERLAAKRQQHDRLLDAADPDREHIRALSTDIELLRARARILEARIAQAASRSPQPAAGDDPAWRLPPGTRVAEFFLGRNEAWLFDAEAGRIRVHALPPPAELAALARDLHLSWRRPAGGTGPRLAAARKLARRLFGPLDAAAPIDRLFVVPDGALHLVPMALLAAEARPALAPGAAVVIPSIATLSTAPDVPSERPVRVAIIADPVYEPADPRIAATLSARAVPDDAAAQDAGAASGLRRLPATAIEARELAALLPDAEAALTLLGPEANRDRVLHAPLDRYRYIHFAVHAFADVRDPALAWLALSNRAADGSPRDGRLRHYDITRLRLDADLVVLSGCDTAIGREIAGEGPIGLSHAFLRSGARAVVATLWQVPDTSTAVLMREFYHQLIEQGLAAPAALARAQARLRREARWSDPYYWAGFQLVSSTGAAPSINDVTGREES